MTNMCLQVTSHGVATAVRADLWKLSFGVSASEKLHTVVSSGCQLVKSYILLYLRGVS
jgi:hypothetical protein